jgi:tRNA uridine 5-carboxymethylaminomethyl modification enzyme
MAGLNAALKASGKPEFTLSRADAYIGVLADDLTSRGATEPYRMFTSRAEYRLTLRADNADQRLTDKAIALGCCGPERIAFHMKKMSQLEQARALFTSLSATPPELAKQGIAVNQDGIRRTAFDLLAYPEMNTEKLATIWPQLSDFPAKIIEQIEIDGLYAGYLDRQQSDIKSFEKDENLKIPADLNYDAVGALSNEVRLKLKQNRPETIGAAARIQGVTPAAIISLLRFVKKAA